MPYYDYFCAANGRTVEVRHGMDESVATWAELCRIAGIPTGGTSPRARVERRIGAAVPLTGRADPGPAPAGAVPGPCGPSCACH